MEAFSKVFVKSSDNLTEQADWVTLEEKNGTYTWSYQHHSKLQIIPISFLYLLSSALYEVFPVTEVTGVVRAICKTFKMKEIVKGKRAKNIKTNWDSLKELIV